MFDREKFKRLVHYIIARAGDDPGFGAIKLNKVLWFADARQYVTTGQAITGAKYTRQQFGPVPAAIMPVIQELQEEGEIRVTRQRAAYEGTRFKSLRAPAAVGLSPEEKLTIDWWIREISTNHTATSISDESHDYAWEIAAMGEPLPFFAFLANRMREPEGEELVWARAMAGRLGAT